MTEEVQLTEDPIQIIEKTKGVDIVGESTNEISKQDILLCGKCHKVCYYVEEFQEHVLLGKCEEGDKEEFMESLKNDTKPQIWAFTLWKNTLHSSEDGDKPDQSPKSWTLYQTWVNLDANVKESWIKAAGNLQSLYNIYSEFNKMKSLTNKTKIYFLQNTEKGKDDEETLESEDRDEYSTTEPNDGVIEKDPLAADGESEPENPEKVDVAEKVAEKKTILKAVQLNEEVTLAPTKKEKASNTKKAQRTGSPPTEDYVVEKIVSKRFNPKKKIFEYLLKWENFNADKNTWEPKSNLQSCLSMLDDFEKKLAAQKIQQKLNKSVDKSLEKKKAAEVVATTPGGRPQRICKQKAMTQVKQWCGNMEADENSSKRIFSDDSDDDVSYEKRMKMEEESTDSENESPIVTIKRINKSNGVDNKKQTLQLPDNILIPDAKGIVRINQKQIPSLSSGVYVMSKTAGIIKLDTNTSKIATSSGHTVLKVAPKIGQTSIKVIRKDMPNGNNVQSKNTANKPKTPVRSYTNTNKSFLEKKRQQMQQTQAGIRKSAELIFANAAAAAALSDKPDEDESDGIEELEFPTDDIPVTAPDSPPADFTLCPLTGQVIGKDGLPIETEVLPEVVTSANDNTAELENLVKMAAADIDMDDEEEAIIASQDVKKEQVEINEDTTISFDPVLLKQDAANSVTPTTTVTKTITRPASNHNVLTRVIRTGPEARKPAVTASILSTALTNANIPTIRRVHPGTLLQRSHQGQQGTPSPQRQIVQKRVGGTSASPQAIITRITPGNNTPRSAGTAGYPVNKTQKQREIFRRKPQQLQPQYQNKTPQVVTPTMHNPHAQQRSLVRRIGETRVYSPARQQVKRQQQLTQQVPPLAAVSKNTYVPPNTSNNTSNMPSLIGVSEAAAATSATTATTSTTVKQQHPQQVQQQQQQQPQEEMEVDAAAATATDTASAETSGAFDLNSLAALNDNEDGPLLITGEDGTIYQVAGQNDEGQTILITQGEDGEQQCLLVAPENAGEINEALMKPQQAQQQQQLQQQQQQAQAEEGEEQIESVEEVEQPLSINTESEEAIDDSQVVAQIVSAQPPSPGGTRKVVLMLPDGNFMMTEVTADQYAALELDK